MACDPASPDTMRCGEGVLADGEWRLGIGENAVVFSSASRGDLPLVDDWASNGLENPAVFDGSSIRFLQPDVNVSVRPDSGRGEEGAPCRHRSSRGWSYRSMPPRSWLVEIQFVDALPVTPGR